jgi:hypothetical protein
LYIYTYIHTYIKGINVGNLNGKKGVIVDSGTTDTYLPIAVKRSFEDLFKKISDGMYICIIINVHVYTHVYVLCDYMNINVHTNSYMYKYIYIYIYMYICLYIFIYTGHTYSNNNVALTREQVAKLPTIIYAVEGDYVCMYVCMYIQINVCMYMCIHIRMSNPISILLS